MTETSLTLSVFHGSHSGRTRKYLSHLETQGQPGKIAAALFRAQKASTRAKAYTGGIVRSDGGFSSFRSLSYDKKSQALRNLCSLLYEDSAGIQWGWGRDEEKPIAPHVLHVDLPTGRVRFHSHERFAGPDYLGNLDGDRASEERVIAFCDSFAVGLVLPPERPRTARAADAWTDVDEDAWED
jgi:hypothetical protein